MNSNQNLGHKQFYQARSWLYKQASMNVSFPAFCVKTQPMGRPLSRTVMLC